MLTAGRLANRIIPIVVFSIILAAVFVVAGYLTGQTYACPGPPPQPLRALYTQSDLIVIAQVGKTEVTRIKNSDDDVELSFLKTALLISSTLKGAPQETVFVDRETYGDYRDQLGSANEGQTFLVFLNKNPEGEGYDIDNMSFGLKQLSDDHLKVYVSRIEELASIMKAEQPSETEIVEWLVRCVEEPATRWEGAFDLAANNYTQQSEEMSINEGASTELSEESPQSEASETPVERAYPNEGWIQSLPVAPTEINYLSLLTAEQKERLTTALINGELVSDRDSYLIEIVEAWDDPRLVPYLLSQLRQIDNASSYYADSVMMIIAQKLDDETLKGIVEKLNAYDDTNETSDAEVDSKNVETDEQRAQRQAALQEASLQKRKTTVDYFIAIAENTVPKTVSVKSVDDTDSSER